jgi:hypothetical protein
LGFRKVLPASSFSDAIVGAAGREIDARMRTEFPQHGPEALYLKQMFAEMVYKVRITEQLQLIAGHLVIYRIYIEADIGDKAGGIAGSKVQCFPIPQTVNVPPLTGA